MKLLTDADLRALATPELARAAMRDAVLAAYSGELVAPPRVRADLGNTKLVFTCGARSGHWRGYRSYLAPGDGGDEQVVVVQDEADGLVRAVAVGQALGPYRVGAIGGVALDALGPRVPERIALLGAGTQAWHQLWALPERFRNATVAVFSRGVARREAFVALAAEELGLRATSAPTAEAAVEGADVVILATSSSTPVIDAAAIRGDAYVATLGPKQRDRSEFEPSLALDASLVVSDSPAQVNAYDPPNVLVGSGVEDRLTHLGAVLAGGVQVPKSGRRMFFSVGLAGTEAWLLEALSHGTPGDPTPD